MIIYLILRAERMHVIVMVKAIESYEIFVI